MSLDYPNTFLELSNFVLAYKRAWTETRPIAKDNLGFRVFSRNLQKNLKVLQSKVQQCIFENQIHSCLKFAEPKNNFTLRWYHILKMEDLIVYQAIANYIAQHFKQGFLDVENNTSFGYVLNYKENEYFYEYWKNGYERFEKLVTSNFLDGKIWRLKTDIVSFFENIEHEILIKQLQETLDEESYPVIQLLSILLRAWSPHDSENHLSRGLPIGPSASSFFANLYLFPIDIEFKNQGFFRYVDDIRIMSGTKQSAIKTFVHLDEALKRIGLNLQTKKTSLDKIYSISQEIQVLKINEANYDDAANEERLEKLLQANIKKARNSSSANKISRFAIYRVTEKHRFWREIIYLIKIDISRCSFYCQLLRQHELVNNLELIRALKKLLIDFDFLAVPLVSILETLAFLGDYSFVSAKIYEWMPKTLLERSKTAWYLRLRLLDIYSQFLNDSQYADDNFLEQIFYKEENPFIQKYLLWYMFKEPKRLHKLSKLKTHIFQGKDVDAVLSAICLECELNPTANFDNFSLGPEIDPYITTPVNEDIRVQQRFSYYVVSFFRINYKGIIDFKTFFQTEYQSACQHIKRAIDSFEVDPENFLVKIDILNALIVEKLFLHRGLEFKEKFKEDLSNAISCNDFRANFPVLQGIFLKIHELRCEHGAHYRSVRMGTFVKPISKSDLTDAREQLSVAYNYLFTILAC